MFEFNTWIVNNLISGVKGNKFSKEWAAVQLANYYMKGKITEADILRFEEETYVPEPEDEVIEVEEPIEPEDEVIDVEEEIVG